MDVAGLAQPVFQDRRADGILVDDDDLERGLHARRASFKRHANTARGQDSHVLSGA